MLAQEAKQFLHSIPRKPDMFIMQATLDTRPLFLIPHSQLGVPILTAYCSKFYWFSRNSDLLLMSLLLATLACRATACGLSFIERTNRSRFTFAATDIGLRCVRYLGISPLVLTVLNRDCSSPDCKDCYLWYKGEHPKIPILMKKAPKP